MFVRNVSIQLKPNCVPTYTKTFQTEILPFLRKQNGFKDEITFVGDSDQVTAISVWDTRLSADTYDKSSYPQVLKMLNTVLEGTPQVHPGDVLHSTFLASSPTAKIL